MLRHAKSVSHQTLSDFDRALNEKGRKDTPMVAKAFLKYGLEPDIILCSAAKRTTETITLFTEAIDLKSPILFLEDLYHASASNIFNILEGHQSYNTIMIVGHNFGISELANHLSLKGAEEMNTCGCYILEFENKIDWNTGHILQYISPKTI